MCSSCERSTSAESGSGFVITRSILRPSALLNLSEVAAARFRRFNPLISCRRRCLQGVSKNGRLTRRFPGARFRGRKPRPKPSCFAVSQNCVSYRHLWQSKRSRLDAAWTWLEMQIRLHGLFSHVSQTRLTGGEESGQGANNGCHCNNPRHDLFLLC